METVKQFMHGTAGGYTNHKCRCEPCTEANKKAHIKWRDRVKFKDLSTLKHGTCSTYSNYGCRCAECTKANTDARRNQRKKATAE